MLDFDHRNETVGRLVPKRERLSILARDSVDNCEVRICALLYDTATELGFLLRIVLRRTVRPAHRAWCS